MLPFCTKHKQANENGIYEDRWRHEFDVKDSIQDANKTLITHLNETNWHVLAVACLDQANLSSWLQVHLCGDRCTLLTSFTLFMGRGIVPV